MEKTMIQLRKSTVTKLQELKRYERETYDDLINSLISELDTEYLSENEIREIEEGLDDVKKGRLHSIRDIAREFKVKL